MKEYIRHDQLIPEQNNIQIFTDTVNINQQASEDKAWGLLLAFGPILLGALLRR
jgi:hypothetical protein